MRSLLQIVLILPGRAHICWMDVFFTFFIFIFYYLFIYLFIYLCDGSGSQLGSRLTFGLLNLAYNYN